MGKQTEVKVKKERKKESYKTRKVFIVTSTGREEAGAKHASLQINQPTKYIIHVPSSGAYKLQVAAFGLPLERGGSSVVGRGRSGRTDHVQRQCYHHVPTVNRRRLLQFISS